MLSDTNVQTNSRAETQGGARISVVSAIARKNRVIGTNDGKIPWHIPEDFAFFRGKTMGHPMIMGRKTFDAFKKPLSGRTHIIISRQNAPENSDYVAENGSRVVWVKNMEEALTVARQIEKEEIFIIGGGQIYTLGLPYADRLYLTFVEGDFLGEVYFPDFESAGFTKIIDRKKSHDENFEYEFITIEK